MTLPIYIPDRYYLRHPRIWWGDIRRHRAARKLPPRHPNPCTGCGTPTHERRLRIVATGQRRVVPYCLDCLLRPDPAQARLRTQRTQKDWREITDPIAHGLLKPGTMPEQIPSYARAALRAFYESGDPRAVVHDVSANVLDQSIASLGLGSEMYAETRSGETVLRRITPTAKKAIS